ncbi:MAG: Polyhydroxyalkanoic acid synthase, partial [uncultured Frankineae bacterium]
GSHGRAGTVRSARTGAGRCGGAVRQIGGGGLAARRHAHRRGAGAGAPHAPGPRRSQAGGSAGLAAGRHDPARTADGGPARPGRRRPVEGRAEPARQALRRPGLDGQPGPAPAVPGLPGERLGARAGRRRGRPRLAQRAADALRRADAGRRAGAVEPPVPQPGSAQGGARHRGAQLHDRAQAVRPGHGLAAAHPVDGRQPGLLGRRQHRRDRRRGGAPHTGLRAPAVRPAHRAGPRGAAAARPPDDQQVLRRRPGSRPQHDPALGGPGAAGLHPVLAQPAGRAPRVGPRHLRRLGPRGPRRGAGDHRPGPQPRHGAVRGRHRQQHRDGPPRREGRARPDRRLHARRHAARPGARRRGGLHGRRGDGAVRGRPVAAQGLPRRQGAGRRVRLAAAQRPDLELLGQQLPARQAAAGLRRAVLEQRHHADGGRAAPRLHPDDAGERAHQAGLADGPGDPDRPVEDRRGQLRRRGQHRPHLPVGQLLPQRAHARRHHPLRPVDGRPHRGSRQPAHQPQVQLPGERRAARVGGGVEGRRGDAPRQLVERPRRLARRAVRRAPGRAAGAGQRRPPAAGARTRHVREGVV